MEESSSLVSACPSGSLNSCCHRSTDDQRIDNSAGKFELGLRGRIIRGVKDRAGELDKRHVGEDKSITAPLFSFNTIKIPSSTEALYAQTPQSDSINLHFYESYL